jgi:hypothetical protein
MHFAITVEIEKVSGTDYTGGLGQMRELSVPCDVVFRLLVF